MTGIKLLYKPSGANTQWFCYSALTAPERGPKSYGDKSYGDRSYRDKSYRKS